MTQTGRELGNCPALRARFTAAAREAQLNQDVRDVAAEARRQITESADSAPSVSSGPPSIGGSIDSDGHMLVHGAAARRWSHREGIWLHQQHDEFEDP